MKRLVIPLTNEEHAAALGVAEERGTTVTAIVREAFGLPPAKPRGRVRVRPVPATAPDPRSTPRRRAAP